MPALFVTELNRSGMRLLIRMMNAHPEIEFALQTDELPNILWSAAEAVLGSELKRSQALTPSNLKAVENAHLETLQYRDSHITGPERSDGFSQELPNDIEGAEYGDTYQELFSKLLDRLRTTDAPWLGINQNHIIEFIPTLARTYTRAKFIVAIRDPRGVIDSAQNRNGGTSDDAMGLDAVYLRWRKYVSLAQRWIDLLGDRVKVVKYETLVTSPEQSMRDLCAHMDLPYDPAMIDADGFTDPETGAGPRNQPAERTGIFSGRVNQWKETISPAALELVEFMCGHEMQALGYELMDSLQPTMSSRAYQLLKTHREDATPGFMERELLRKHLILYPEAYCPRETLDKLFLHPKIRTERRLLAGSVLGE